MKCKTPKCQTVRVSIYLTAEEAIVLELIAKAKGYGTTAGRGYSAIAAYGKALLFERANQREVKGTMAILNGLFDYQTQIQDRIKHWQDKHENTSQTE